MFYSPPFLSLKTPFVMSNPEMAGIGLLNFLHLILSFFKSSSMARFNDEQSESQGFRLMKFRLFSLKWQCFKLEEM